MKKYLIGAMTVFACATGYHDWAHAAKSIPGFVPSTRVNVTVVTSIERRQGGDTFTYRYTLHSDSSSEQDVFNLALSHGADGRSVGSPPNWAGGPMKGSNYFLWGAFDVSDTVRPGQSLGGFSFESKGVPSIQEFRTQGWVAHSPFSLEDGGGLPPGITIEDLRTATSFFNNSVAGAAVGPANVTSNATTETLINHVIQQKHSAVSHGWIRGQGIVISLDKKLDAALASHLRGQNRPAANQIRAFRSELRAQTGKNVSSEAAAILDSTAALVLERL